MISYDEMSAYTKSLVTEKEYSNGQKLVTTLHSRMKYIILYNSNAPTKDYPQSNIKLKTIHREIDFTEKPLMKDYIEKNTISRGNFSIEFEKGGG